MRISVMDLQVGDRTGSDVFNWNGLLVVSAHTVLNADDIDKLQLHNIDYVDIMMRQAEHSTEKQLQPALSEPTQTLAQTAAYEEAVSGIKDLFNQITAQGKIEEKQVEQCFAPLANHFIEQKDVVSLLLTLNNKDDYTYQHSVQVGMISYYIAKWLGQTEEEALYAGKAGYLHDLGKSRIDNAILQKPGFLTKDEFEQVKKHAEYGHEMILASGLPEPIALAALQHHERLDGTGYPARLRGQDIHPLARIVAVADVYSAMISHRVYQEKQDLLHVLKELHRLSFGKLDPKITQVFIRNMIPNFINKRILLTNGENGIIIMTHPTDFFRPLIQVGEQFINLSEHPQLEIQEIYM
ncbi:MULTISPECIES: HD-GYP domain-containing protein [unclassified Paenibacillus]|uniref:HD-GYP domain-containing protein n=1 Tax=unclassified Paenibacillus TaxID=185978 RepID=UPI0009ADBBD7|nr:MULTISPECIES: HD-GYP domain-containing protein [unclassified Paenibacillus]MBE1441389.1 putative nucleotidyltransferase with HDIG domain [Paenibacillus sp. OAS669]